MGEGGAKSKSGCANLLFCIFFAENCMEMKEFGPGGGGMCPWRPLGSTMVKPLFRSPLFYTNILWKKVTGHGNSEVMGSTRTIYLVF